MNTQAQRHRPSPAPHLSLVPLSILVMALGVLSGMTALLFQPVKPGLPAVPKATVNPPAVVPMPAPITATTTPTPPPIPPLVQAESAARPLAARQVTVPDGTRFEAALLRKTLPAVKLTSFDESILEALVKNWVPPAGTAVPPAQREAVMDLVITHEGILETYTLVHASGQSQLDMSVLRAAGMAKQIPGAWPSEFSGDRCEVRIHFRALSR